MSRCINSDDIHFAAFRDTLLDLTPEFNDGKPIDREFYDANMAGALNPEIMKRIMPEKPLEEQQHIAETKEERYEEKVRGGATPIDGLLDLLDLCKRCNVIHYIVTNAPRGSCKTTMKSIGIEPIFGSNVVVGADCEYPKPHPAPYLRGLELAGVPSNAAIAFEDSPNGTKSATRAGIYTIGLRSTQSDELLRAAGAAFTISDYTDPLLIDFLKKYDLQ